MAAIGYGEYTAENVLRRVRNLGGAKGEGETDSLSAVANALLARKVKTRTNSNETELPPGSLQLGDAQENESDDAILRRNRVLDDVLFTLAKCCAPLPGDAVRGYVTRGRGVTVHREECPNLAHYEAREPGRIINAQWRGDGQKAYRALVAIESRDRVGLLHDVTSVFSETHVNIHAVNTYPLKDSRARLNIAITITDVNQLNTLMVKLRGVEGVTEVHRV